MRLPALTELTPRQLLYGFATRILRDHFVDQETFDSALAEWGEAGLVEQAPSEG
jgi:hypothetical protein